MTRVGHARSVIRCSGAGSATCHFEFVDNWKSHEHSLSSDDLAGAVLHRSGNLSQGDRAFLLRPVDLRRTRQLHPQSGRLFPVRAGWRKRHRHPGRLRRGARVLQRLPPSRDAPVRDVPRRVSGPHHVPVSRLVVWTRRRATGRAARRAPRFFALRLSASFRSHRDLGRQRVPAFRLAAGIGGGDARSGRQEIRELAHVGAAPAPAHGLRRQSQLEADRPQLQRMPALPLRASGSEPSDRLPGRG